MRQRETETETEAETERERVKTQTPGGPTAVASVSGKARSAFTGGSGGFMCVKGAKKSQKSPLDRTESSEVSFWGSIWVFRVFEKDVSE